MFEKEAEEYIRKNQPDVINWGGAEPEERFYNEIKFKQAYLAGAEFGYNKAMNEVKGIIKDLLNCLPKENIEGVYEVAEEAEQFLRWKNEKINKRTN